MTKKTIGRKPLGEEKKSHKIHFGVTFKEYQIIMKRAGPYGSISKYLREAAFNGEVIPKFMPEEEVLFDKLVAACPEFHRLAESAEIKDVLHYLRTVVGPLVDELSEAQRKAKKERERIKSRAAARLAAAPSSPRQDNV